jgi:hypothetical protein
MRPTMNMNHTRVRQAGTVLAVVSVGLTTTLPAEAIASSWRLAKTYTSSVTGGYAVTTAVAAFGGKDAWAFSADLFDNDRLPRPTAHHWNGKAWRTVPLPAGLWGGIFSVHRSSPTNVWAVGGGDLHGNNGPGGYALRWNGKKWSIAKKWKNGVHTVTAISPSNVWVYGGSGADQGVGNWHFNGRTWTKKQPLPGLSLIATSVVSKNNVWAAGGDMVARYNGSRWTQVSVGKTLPPPIPYQPGKPYRTIAYGAVQAFSAGNVWVAGAIYNADGKGEYTTTPFLLHRSGATWRCVPITADRRPQYLRSLHSDGRGGLWILGSDRRGAEVVYRRASSGKWSATAAPTVKGRNAHLAQISNIPGTSALWAAGQIRATDHSFSTGALWHLPR